MEKDEVNKKVMEFVANSLQDITNAKDWLKGELPLVLQEWLGWQFLENLAIAVVSFSMAAVLTVWVIRRMRKPNYDILDDPTILVPLFFLALLGSVMVSSTLDCVQISMYPRVYLLDTAKQMLSK